MEIYKQFREHMIGVMQVAMKPIRLVLGLGVQELGDIMGLSRQSINNLENGKVQMNYSQYVAFISVIDYICSINTELKNVIKSILVKSDYDETNKIYEDIDEDTFIKKWLRCFPDELDKLLPLISSVEDLTENYRVFIDSSVLFHVSGYKEFSELCDAMEKNHHSFIIPVTAVYEIKEKLLNENNVVKKMANEAIETLAKLQSRGIIEFRGEQDDNDTNSLLVSVFQRFKVTHKLALITQDSELAEEILALNDSDIGGFQIVSYHFNAFGNLEKWDIVREYYIEDSEINCSESVLSDTAADDTVQEEGDYENTEEHLENLVPDSPIEEEDEPKNEVENKLNGWDSI